jgi:hypothetical protein
MGNTPSVTLDTYGHVFDERIPDSSLDPAEAIEAGQAEFDVREMYAAREARRPLSPSIPHQMTKPSSGLEPETPSLPRALTASSRVAGTRRRSL